MNNLICVWWNPNICFNNNHNNNGLLYGHQQNCWKQQRTKTTLLSLRLTFFRMLFCNKLKCRKLRSSTKWLEANEPKLPFLKTLFRALFSSKPKYIKFSIEATEYSVILKKTVVKELFLEKDSALDLALKLVISQKIRHIICC